LITHTNRHNFKIGFKSYWLSFILFSRLRTQRQMSGSSDLYRYVFRYVTVSFRYNIWSFLRYVTNFFLKNSRNFFYFVDKILNFSQHIIVTGYLQKSERKLFYQNTTKCEYHIIATTICDYNNQGLYRFEIPKFYDISMIFHSIF
jgi:hypothetical protein